jgi:DNA end-binding protein Ku
MAPRASWKGFLKVGELVCHVGLYAAASTAERVAFHTVNRETGHRVKRQFVDDETGKPVDKEDQVKGYEVGKDEFVVLEPDEITAVIPESDKTLRVETFLPCSEIDKLYFDRPYYLTPADDASAKGFAVIRNGMRKTNTAALARTVLFRRVRTVLIRPYEEGLIANTLQFDYEIRSVKTAFKDIPSLKIKGEMLKLAEHIIKTKSGKFDPSKFDDRYEAAVAELVKAKLEGKPIPKPKPRETGKVIDLMEALRQSAGKRKSKPANRRSSSSGKLASKQGAKSRRRPAKQQRKAS